MSGFSLITGVISVLTRGYSLVTGIITSSGQPECSENFHGLIRDSEAFQSNIQEEALFIGIIDDTAISVIGLIDDTVISVQGKITTEVSFNGIITESESFNGKLCE